MNVLRFSLLICFLVGCADHSAFGDTVNNSLSFGGACGINDARAFWFIEGTNGGYPEVYVGFDEGTHTTRSATLRIREHGVVERQEMRSEPFAGEWGAICLFTGATGYCRKELYAILP